jgi:hypothetical protein
LCSPQCQRSADKLHHERHKALIKLLLPRRPPSATPRKYDLEKERAYYAVNRGRAKEWAKQRRERERIALAAYREMEKNHVSRK